MHYLAFAAFFMLLAGPLQADRITAGTAHNLVAKGNGSQFVWGANDNGQLGDGTTLDALNPIAVVDIRYNALDGAIAVVAHGDNSLVLLDNATLLGWGPNENGQLGSGVLYRGKYLNLPEEAESDGGDATDGEETEPAPADNTLLFPTVIVDPDGKPLSNITAIALGANFAAAVNQEGNVLVCGNLEAFKDREQDREPVNRYRDKFFDPTIEFIDSQYKDGDPVDEFELLYMTDQQGNRVPGIVAVAVGDDHLLALTNTGNVLAWGENDSGQLGDGSQRQSAYPVYVRNPQQAVIGGIVSIAAIDNRSWAITADGHLLGWGGGVAAVPLEEETDETEVTNADPRSAEYYAQPVTDDEGRPITGVRKLAPGSSHILALTFDSRVIGWGSNSNGQLGTGSNADVPGTAKVITRNGQRLADVSEIAVGSTHSLAVLHNGLVYAWGSGENGRLGDGTNIDSYFAVNVRSRSNAAFSLF